MGNRGLLTALLFVMLTQWVTGQGVLQPKQLNFDNQGIVYSKELAFNIKVHTNGYAFGVNIGDLKTYYLTRFYHLSLGELKHPREFRKNDFIAATGGGARSYIFGKQNNLFVLRGGLGEKRYLSEKAKRKGLAVGISYEAGPSIGILKPYYLEIATLDNPGNDTRSVKYTPETEDLFTNVNSITGSSGLGKGWGEVKIQPGLHAVAATHFDWGAFDEFVKALEVGIMGDFYFKKLPLMIESERFSNSENQSFYINLFVNFQFGKRR